MSEEGQKNLTFTDPRVLQALYGWRAGLEENRGDRAMLRRCQSPVEVAFTPAFHRLGSALREIARVDPDRLARVAGVIAHARLQEGPSRDRFAQQLAESAGGRARVSGLRFRRLLAEDDPERLYEMMIRLVRHLDGNADLGSLAQGLYWWNQQTKKRWAQDYYERAPEET
jgi:CRISPR system Cascade subunit CasB